MYTITNGILSLSLDERARLTSLENLKTGKGNVISRPAPLFRAVLHTGENWEDVAWAKDANLTVSASESELRVEAASLRTRMGEKDIRLTLTIRLEGELVRFGASIDNRSESTLNDFYYPCVGAIQTLGHGAPGLLYPDFFGTYYTDIISELIAREGWDGGKVLTTPYPYTLSMQ